MLPRQALTRKPGTRAPSRRTCLNRLTSPPKIKRTTPARETRKHEVAADGSHAGGVPGPPLQARRQAERPMPPRRPLHPLKPAARRDGRRTMMRPRQ